MHTTIRFFLKVKLCPPFEKAPPLPFRQGAFVGHINLDEGGIFVPDWIIQTVFLTLLGINSFFLKSYKNQLDKNDEQLKAQVEQVKVDLHRYKLNAAERFVQKDDFIRATAVTDRKLDRIYDELMKINKRNAGEKS